MALISHANLEPFFFFFYKTDNLPEKAIFKVRRLHNQNGAPETEQQVPPAPRPGRAPSPPPDPDRPRRRAHSPEAMAPLRSAPRRASGPKAAAVSQPAAPSSAAGTPASPRPPPGRLPPARPPLVCGSHLPTPLILALRKARRRPSRVQKPGGEAPRGRAPAAGEPGARLWGISRL